MSISKHCIKRVFRRFDLVALALALVFCAGCPGGGTKSSGPAEKAKLEPVDNRLIGEISAAQLEEWKMKAVLGELEESFNWAVCLYIGESVEKDVEGAKKLFGQLKESKDKGVQLFLKRIEIEADEAQVKEWMEKGKGGDDEAMVNVAISYFLGQGIAEDRIQAVKWVYAASTHQEHDGIIGLLEGRLGERLSFRQLGHARRLAREEGLAAVSKE